MIKRHFKKIFEISIVSSLLCCVLASCNEKQAQNIKAAQIEEVSQTNQNATEKVDIDFSKMNYNLVSAQIFNIMIEPEKYMGKTMRFKGQFYSSFEEEIGERTYSVLIYDATACCQVGLQFILNGEHEYPQDFPEELSNIEVCGKLCIKELNGFDYLYIDCDEIIRS